MSVETPPLPQKATPNVSGPADPSRPVDFAPASLSKTLGRLLFIPWERRAESDPLHTDLSYEMAWWINRTWFRVFHSVQYRRMDNVPMHGPVIYAPNHVSFYDPTLVAAGVPYRMRFMAWDALFRVPIVKQILVKYGGYPVKLQSADKGAIEQTLRILRNGEAVMIFPEGERSEDGELLPFENGIARLALQTGATIVPVTVTGVLESFGRQYMFPRLFRPICVYYHDPIPVERPTDRSEMRARMAEINEAIRRPIARRLAAYKRLKAYQKKKEGVWHRP